MIRFLLIILISIGPVALRAQLFPFGNAWENPAGRNMEFRNDSAWYLASGAPDQQSPQSIQIFQFQTQPWSAPVVVKNLSHNTPLYGEQLLSFPDGRWLVVGTHFPPNLPAQGFHSVLRADWQTDTLLFTAFPGRLVQWKTAAIVSNQLFYLTGTITQENGGANDIYVALFHTEQGKIWDRTLGTEENETAQAHLLFPDASLLIAADKNDGNNVKQHFARIDSTGFILWEIDSDYPLSHGAQSLALMNDTLAVCIGESTVPQMAGFDVLLSQIHIDGRMIRHLRFGGPGTDAGFWIQKGPSGVYWMTGYSNSHDINAPTSPFFAELNADWSQLKTQIWPAPELCFPRSAQVIPVQDSLRIMFAAAGQSQHYYLQETIQLVSSAPFQITDTVLTSGVHISSPPFWMTPSEVKWPAQTYKGILSIYALNGQKLVEWDVENGSTKGISLPFGVYMLQWQVHGANWPAKLWMYSD